jgi:uncharacterized protein
LKKVFYTFFFAIHFGDGDSMNAEEKLKRLMGILKEMGSVVVALSGGVDSSFLLKVARDVLGNKALAATAISYNYPSWEMEEAEKFADELGAEHLKISFDPLKEVPGFDKNPIDRCYICKKAVFSALLRHAEDLGINYVVDGTNADDLGDYRPGLKAVEELGIKSPLLMAGLTKNDIRFLAKEMGLSIHDKPSFACLSTRIPYGDEITREKLQMIDNAEKYIMSKGIRNVRVRCHGNLARIEVERNDIPKFYNIDFMTDIEQRLKEYGFKYVSLDLSGYKTGSMNLEVTAANE